MLLAVPGTYQQVPCCERFSFDMQVVTSSCSVRFHSGKPHQHTEAGYMKRTQVSHEHAWSERLLSPAGAESPVSRPATKSAFLVVAKLPRKLPNKQATEAEELEQRSVTAAPAATRARRITLRRSLTTPDARSLADWLGKSTPAPRPLRPLRLRQDPAPRHVWPTPHCRTSVTPDAELAARNPPWCTAATDRSLLGKLTAFGNRSSNLAPDIGITPCALHRQCEMRMHAFVWYRGFYDAIPYHSSFQVRCENLDIPRPSSLVDSWICGMTVVVDIHLRSRHQPMMIITIIATTHQP